MKSKKPAWLSGCTVCNAGIVSRIDELKKQGHSIQDACKIMEAEALETDGILSISANAISHRYGHMKGTRGDWSQSQHGNEISNNIRKLLRSLRTASGKLQIINNELANNQITQIDGIEALLAKVDLAQFAAEFTMFIQYFRDKGIISNEVTDKKARLKREN